MTKGAAKLTSAELSQRYPDKELQRNLLELLDLRLFLAECVITSNYKVPDDLSGKILLTPYGDDFLRALKKHNVPTKEARLLAFLEFSHLDLLIDPEHTAADSLADAISDEISSQRIHLPFVFSPALYDRASMLFPHEKTHLSVRDTERLLDGMPQGVFQVGHWVSGPLGLLRSDCVRVLPPRRAIPLMHCHDISCAVVHRVSLSTDPTAEINEKRYLASKYLDSQSDDPSEFDEFFFELSRDVKHNHDDFHTGVLPIMLGECLGDDELKGLLARVVELGQSAIREKFALYGLLGDVTSWLAGKDRATVLQLVLLVEDSHLTRALDDLVFSQGLYMPAGEIRTPVLHRGAASGAHHVRCRLSSFGLQVAPDSGAAPLRLRRVVDRLYAGGSPAAKEGGQLEQAFDRNQELDWQLRGVSGVNVTARLEEYLRTEEPDRALERLALVSRSNISEVAHHLGLERIDGITDGDLINRILWKLGFEVDSHHEYRDRFWTLHDRMSQGARAASVSTIVDQEAMRGLSANYFVALEELLFDSLMFATWVLLTDHPRQRKPFRYTPETDALSSGEELTRFSESISPIGRTPNTYGEKVTLYALCQGFGDLEKLLRVRVEEGAQHARPEDEFPSFAGHTDLMKFPFLHKVLFLDLTPTSQAGVLSTLHKITTILSRGTVWDVRNEQLHFRRASSDLDRLISSLEAIEEAVRVLEDSGFARSLFYPDRTESDRWGRRTIYFSNRQGKEFAVGRPSQYSALNLPRLSEPQYLIGCAQFAEPNEIVRISLGFDSPFSRMWASVPQRRLAAAADGLGVEDGEPSLTSRTT